MASTHKPQRVRDPVHNLIEFGTHQFEHVMWSVIQTPPFQRLRRIKQLGFSDLVYPGATHTRFAHCIGVFHTARHLMQIIERDIITRGHQFQAYQAQVALAAALVHDLGHGMFSHAFEYVGKTMGLKMARHETVSDQLIRNSEVSDVLKSNLGSGFADDVAAVIKRGRPGNLYDAVVSSQFDADRLDYMQRDRLQTGVQNSGIDFTWLISNLQIGTVPRGVDNEPLAEIETFVIGPKAISAAETYVLSLFQLYPTIYFHKATRAAEKIFSALMSRLITLARADQVEKTGLFKKHPIILFALDPDSLAHALALDDTVFWGSIPLMVEAEDRSISTLAKRLRERRLPKCIDIGERLLAHTAAMRRTNRADAEKLLNRLTTKIQDDLESWSDKKSTETPRILIDRTERDPYKRLDESKGPLSQILTRTAGGKVLDLAELSATVAGIEKFHLFRAYVDSTDGDARTIIDSTIEQALRSNSDAD